MGGNSGYLGQSSAPSSGAGQTPDPAGQGALRFTNGYTPGHSGFNYGFNQSGGIISTSTFGTGAGVQVVFKTVTYHGDSGGSGGDGADGMNFFLLDGGYPVYDVGAFGGSLGYTCSNTNNDTNLHPDGTPRGYDGVQHGYLGLGMDEFGNFLNQSDNTATGFGFQPGRIGLRGAGNIGWGQLNALNSSYYPVRSAPHNAPPPCKTPAKRAICGTIPTHRRRIRPRRPWPTTPPFMPPMAWVPTRCSPRSRSPMRAP